jgi:hypothetical protein
MFSWFRKRVIFCFMKKPSSESVFLNLRDAYKIPGFHVRSTIAQCDTDQGSFVLTLDRRSKKHSAAAALNDVAAFMTNVGGGCVILGAVIATFISPSRCAA